MLALVALEARHSGSRNRLVPEPADERLQLREDMDAALAHLREVRDRYWDHDWRRAHRGYGRYPENELWDAVEGFLDLIGASRSGGAGHLRSRDQPGATRPGSGPPYASLTVQPLSPGRTPWSASVRQETRKRNMPVPSFAVKNSTMPALNSWRRAAGTLIASNPCDMRCPFIM